MRRSVIQSITFSLATQLRRRRFALFKALLSSLPRPLRILDVGGEQEFWERVDFANEPGVEIVLLNVKTLKANGANFRFVAGDARNMSAFPDREFDVVFSNSVIEHLGEYAQQHLMAGEVRRVGRRFFLQTPNRYFPLEPHFLFPFFQFLPVRLRVLLLSRFRLGWHKREPDRREAERVVKGIRLLTVRELQALFPGARIWREKFLGLTKSFIVFKGWEESASEDGGQAR